YSNGDVYNGCLVNGLRQGNGHLNSNTNGHSYKGFWQNDKREGYGTLITKEYSYTGEWSNNKKSGRGIVQYPNGEKHETVWVDDVCLGFSLIILKINCFLDNHNHKNNGVWGLGFGVWGLGFGVWGL